MKFPESIRLFGNKDFRGNCPKEQLEQSSFFSKLRREHPDSYGIIALHPRNEGLIKAGQFQAMAKKRVEGMAVGAADIVIPGCPAFVCELKRQDHTKSHWQEGQIAYLEAAQDSGAFVCVALGAAAAWEAFLEWRGLNVLQLR